MKINIHPSVILWLSVLFYLERKIVLPFLAAVAFHELGHYLMFRLLRKQPESLTVGFSGAAMAASYLSYREEFLIALAGPLFSLILGAFLPVWPELGFYSLVLCGFNLLPIPGLDGARMLRSWSLSRLSAETAARLCRFAALLTALAAWGAGLYLSLPMHFGLWPMLLTAVFLFKALSMETI